MNNKSSDRQKKLFLDQPIIKSILLVSLPALAMAIMTALYIFADQLMMVNLIPKVHTNQEMFGSNWPAYEAIINSPQYSFVSQCSVASVVRTATAYSTPATLLINASTLLIGNGTAIKFNNFSGKKEFGKAQKVYQRGFYSNLFLSMLLTVFVLMFSYVWILIQRGGDLNKALSNLTQAVTDGKISQSDANIVKSVYETAFTNSFNYALHFMLIIGAGCIFSMFTQFYALLIIAEGKQASVVLVSLGCNILNIGLDFIFIWFAKLAMVGGAIALVIGWAVSTCSYMLFILRMQKKNETVLRYELLKHVNWNWSEFRTIFTYGLPSFLRNTGMALFMTLHLGLLGFVTTHTNSGVNSEYQDIYGAVNPIYNLFYVGLVGVINGARSTAAYNHGAGQLLRVKQSVWILNIFGWIYGVIVLGVVGFGLSPYLLNLFYINNSDPQKLHDAKLMLIIAVLQLPIYGMIIGSMMLFQATGKWKQASIIASMEFLCGLIVSIILMLIAWKTNNVNIYLWNPVATTGLASIVCFAWGQIHLHKQYKV